MGPEPRPNYKITRSLLVKNIMSTLSQEPKAPVCIPPPPFLRILFWNASSGPCHGKARLTRDPQAFQLFHRMKKKNILAKKIFVSMLDREKSLASVLTKQHRMHLRQIFLRCILLVSFHLYRFHFEVTVFICPHGFFSTSDVLFPYAQWRDIEAPIFLF